MDHLLYLLIKIELTCDRKLLKKSIDQYEIQIIKEANHTKYEALITLANNTMDTGVTKLYGFIEFRGVFAKFSRW